MADDQSGNILSTDLNQGMRSIRDIIAVKMDAVHKELGDVKERLAKLEKAYDASMSSKITEAREEGRIFGRMEALEKRMDKSERWTLGIGVGVVVSVVSWVLAAIKR